MGEEIGVAIIGSGAGARLSVEGLKSVEGARLIAVAGGRKSPALGRELGVSCFQSVDALLHESTVRLVIVASPSDLHYAHAQAALLAGKNVLVEKPLATRSADARRLIALASSVGLWLGVMHQYRYDPAHRLLFAAFSERLFGPSPHLVAVLHMARPAEYYLSLPWRADPTRGGGVIWNQGLHLLDLLLWWLGPLTPLLASFERPLSSVEAEQVVTAELAAGNGATVHLNARTDLGPDHMLRVEVQGLSGTAIVENHAAGSWHFTSPKASGRYAELAREIDGCEQAWQPGQGHAALITDAIASILGTARPLVTARDGLACVELAEALRRQAQSHQDG